MNTYEPVTLAEIMQIDAATYELPDNYTPRDVENLQWLFHRMRDNEHVITDLQAQLKTLKSKKVPELVKPLPKHVNFEDLMEKLLEIHIAEHETVEIGSERGHTGELRRRTDKTVILFRRVAEMIILLTTYLDKLGVDEKARRELFAAVQSKEWFKCM